MAIIGISGHSGSGKNTVGIIIQYLLSQEGKPPIEEVCKNYSDNEWWLEDSSGWELRMFADKLKDIAEHITGISKDKFEYQDFKKTELGPEWNTIEYIKKYKEPFPTDDSIPIEIKEVSKPMTVRELLQKLGTDAMRNNLHPNIWVNALMADYKCEFQIIADSQLTNNPLPLQIPTNELGQDPNWIITDVRFMNEAIAIKNQGGIIIRVDRPSVQLVNDHPSETALDNWNFDYKVANVSDIFDLKQNIEQILKHKQLL